MNFQEMDALGGLIEGNKARMTEDSTRINQENVLAQIAKMAQEQQQSAQMHPLRMQELESQNAERASLGKMREQQIQESNARMTRESAAAYLKDMVTIPMVPGAEDALAEQHKIPANHPLRKAAAQARAASVNWDPAKGKSPYEQLQERVASSTPEARTQAAQAKAQFDRETLRQTEQTNREQMKIESRERTARLAADAKIKAQELKSAAQQLGVKRLEDKAAALIEKAQLATSLGKEQEAAQARKEAEEMLQAAKGLLVIKDQTKRDAEADRLYKLSGGKFDFRRDGGTTPSTTAPAATQVDQKMAAEIGPSYDPAKFEYRKNPQTGKWQSKPKTAAVESAKPASTETPVYDQWWMPKSGTTQ